MCVLIMIWIGCVWVGDGDVSLVGRGDGGRLMGFWLAGCTGFIVI